MYKRFKKVSLIEPYEIKGFLEGPIFAYGKLGGGKTVSLMSVIQGFHDNFGYKIFDIYGGSRYEGLYWTIPSQELSYWNKLNTLGKFDEQGPKQYKVNLLYPYFESKLPKKLPKKEPFVNSKLFTIPLKSVAPEDISMIIGVLSESSKYCWQELQHNATKKTHAGDLIELAKKTKGITNTPLYKNVIIPFSREKFLMDSYCDYNIDITEELKDKETISVLCLEFVPKQYHLFVINYLLNKMVELLEANKITRKNIVFMRETSIFFKATDTAIVEDRFKIFRSLLSDYIRMGRRGMYFAMDTQSACLEENTKIQTLINNEFCTKKIKDLSSSFKVISYNFKNKKYEINNAIKVYNGKKDCFKIIFDDNTCVIATKEHRFFDRNKEEIKVENLKVNDVLFFAK